MKHSEKTSANWRELAFYSVFATVITTLNASVSVLLGF